MFRRLLGILIAALIVSLGVSGAEAAKGKSKKNAEKKLSGEIQAVNDDQSVLTISTKHAKKGKAKADAANPKPKKGKGKGKKDGPTQELRVTAGTFIEYVGIDDQDDKKLKKGYYVMATLADDGSAKTLSVSKSPFENAKKGKKKKNA